MIWNYLKIAIRNLLKNKWFSLINITGLAVGIGCCILIFAWAERETQVNQFHKNLDQVHLVRTLQEYGDRKERSSGTPPALGPALKAEFPEVINMTRINNGRKLLLLQYNDIRQKEHFFFSDPNIFEMFSFPILQGNLDDAFGDPNVIILSEKLAQKYFGDENPVGKTVSLDNRYDLLVVGVMEDIPNISTIQFDFWIPIQFLKTLNRPNYIDTWYNLAFRTYVLLEPGTPINDFNNKIIDRIRQSRPETHSEPFVYPFSDLYLKLYGMGAQVSLFTIIALFILLIACTNYINISTARASDRAKEIGLRKVVGAMQKQLIYQFFMESMILTLIATIFALLLVDMTIPLLGQVLGENFNINYFGDSNILIGIIAVTLFTGIISGIFPALILSSINPIRAIAGKIFQTTNTGSLRKVLVVSQFVISSFLIIATLIIFNQVDFMRTKHLGFDKDHMIYTPLQGELKDKNELYKSELQKLPAIQNVSFTSHSPTGIYWNGQDWTWEGKDPAVNPLVTYFCVDGDFLETFDIKMKEGQFFNKDDVSISNNIVINETYADLMGFESTPGQLIRHGDESYKIIGVTHNFHYKPFYYNIGPLIIFSDKEARNFKYAFIKLSSKNMSASLADIEKITLALNPDFPFEYRFLDEDYSTMYLQIEEFTDIIRSFAILAIFISCLGLFGLASYMTEHRTKEIGVRKALGATVSGILYILSKEFTKWVLIANLISWPIAYIFASFWLRNFAYRVSIHIDIFLLAGFITFLLALVTVSSQSIKTALSDPVKALRYE